MKEHTEKKQSHIAWIWNIWKERKGMIVLLLVLTLISSFVAVAFPLLTRKLFDLFQSIIEKKAEFSDPQKEISKIALYFLALGVAGFISGFFPGIRGALNVVFDYIIRNKYFRSIEEKDYRFFSRYSSGDLTTRLTSDISDFPRLSWFMCSGIFRAVESTSKVIFCIVAMLALNWKLALFSLAPLPLMLWIFSKTQDTIYDRVKKNEQSVSSINEQLEMSFSGARIIKAFASEAKYERFFDSALKKRFKTETGVIKMQTILDLIYQYIDYVAQILLIFIGGMMVVKGSITIGTFYAFYNLLNMLIYPILDIPNLFVSGKRAFVNIDRLEELKDFEVPDRDPSQVPIKEFEKLELVAASFQYEGRDKPALDKVSFELERGDRLLVIGPVGSGKTTLAKMMAGLLPVQQGGLFVNGLPFSKIETADWSAMLGYVPQEALLFSGSIEENVAFGTNESPPEITKDELWRYLETAQIGDEVRAFPKREETLLGQRGISVSGGQKQRIAIARALARKPQIVVFDDMTASLDTKNEEKLWQALQDHDKTIIAVSHRLSSIQYVDKVLFLKEGRVMGFGAHEKLMAGNADYREFVASHIRLDAKNRLKMDCV
ncbi:MAG: ABC transporter ATP-binding protein/permease [Spirochaetaceae bacterium]|nr:ABC transporter ATP-binding protein/permease [Spirochaetaceae bacterium]